MCIITSRKNKHVRVPRSAGSSGSGWLSKPNFELPDFLVTVNSCIFPLLYLIYYP
ncbi:hypothetical protein EI94DRAFT_1722945 [Lactarius quietus]|nr:hypothetical protein EI94DRAFT_1722945 [Lactarius quietus]